MSGEKEKKRQHSKKCIGRRQKSHKSQPTLVTQTVQETNNHAEVSFEMVQEQLLKMQLPQGWNITSLQNEIQCFEVTRQPCLPPMVISRLLLIKSDLSWQVFITDHAIKEDNEVLIPFPNPITQDNLMPLINKLHAAKICTGNYKAQFVQLARIRKCKFFSASGQLVARLEETICITVDGNNFSATIRHVNCAVLLIDASICQVCYGYRNTLRALFSKSKRVTKTSVHVPVCRLLTPQRRPYFMSLQKAIRNKNRQIQRLKIKVNKLIAANSCVKVDDSLNADISNVIDKYEEIEKDDFKRIFWEQKVAASKKKKKQGMRWHPLFIRWCLNIMLTSSKAYDIMRESDLITLPSKRTLRDYTHWHKLEPGFDATVINYLRKEIKIDTLEDWRKYVVIAFDEMKIREDLVFDKTTGEITGFVDYGQQSLDQRFATLKEECMKHQPLKQRTVATHMLTIMVRGIFFKLNFPFAHFATTGVSANYLMYIVWRAVRMLQLAGLQVICIVADGATSNRKFFKKHRIDKLCKSDVTYVTPNICSTPGSYIYFIADVPHLIKTVRNAWHNSQSSRTRSLTNNGKEIKWSHIVELAEKSVADSGMYLAKKLSREHIVLTSYSRMTVRLAVQVLSTNVANGFATMRKLQIMTVDTEETERFCRIFDKFFDIFNTRVIEENIRKKKPNLKPFYGDDDSRLKWLEEDMLQYLKDWEKWVSQETTIPKEAKPFCTLPQQTLEGIRICCHSLSGIVKCLLNHPNAKYVLTERFNQDTVEIFFAQQRARGHRNDNPSVSQFPSFNCVAYGGSSSISRKRRTPDLSPVSRPLPKRPHLRTIKFD